MARGDRREEIFRDNRDRSKFVGDLAGGAERYRVKVHCYVLTENHFHLVATTPEGNLSKWMHQLKTAYTVYFNRRHQVVGHLFQGRFKSTVIEAEKYLLEVSRYLHLNPVLCWDHAGLSHDEIAALFRMPSSNSVAQTIRRTKTHDVQTLKVFKHQISHK